MSNRLPAPPISYSPKTRLRSRRP